MSKAMLARIKKARAALQPSATGRTGAGAIPLWRQSDIDPTLFRPENGGEWIPEAAMLAQCPSRGKYPRVVIVCGTWSQAKIQGFS